MRKMVSKVVFILAESRGSIEKFGEMMGLGWIYKRGLSHKESIPQIDKICKEPMRAAERFLELSAADLCCLSRSRRGMMQFGCASKSGCM